MKKIKKWFVHKILGRWFVVTKSGRVVKFDDGRWIRK